jgi:hypothetical protein
MKSWDKAVEAIGNIPEIHHAKAKAEALEYWERRRKGWGQNFTAQLKEFKNQKDRLGQFTIPQLLAREHFPRFWLSNSEWERAWMREEEQRQLEGA